MSSVFDLYQSYLNDLQNPVMQNPVYYSGIMALPQTQMISQDDNVNNISIAQGRDYTQIPSMYSQYMQPRGIMDVLGLAMNPLGYAAGKSAQYLSDQSLAKDVQEMGIGFGGATSDDRAGGGGFGGDTAGGFSESDPTATEGSF